MGFLVRTKGNLNQLLKVVNLAVRSPKKLRHPRLSTELREVVAVCLPILELLVVQLNDVATEVETKVVDSCNSLMGIASRANNLVDIAKSEFDGGSSEAELIETTREVIGNLLDCIQESTSFSSFTTQRLQNIEDDLGSVTDSLAGVTKIAEVAKVVAINGRIEAGRAGKAGNAFSVVAEETGNLANMAMSTNQDVCDTVKDLGETLHSTSSNLEERHTTDSQQASQFRTAGEQLLNELDEHNLQMKNRLESLSTVGAQIATEVSNTIVALQFQDSVNQRISHVVSTIEEIREQMDPFAKGVHSSLVESRTSEWKERIAAGYTMNAERMIHDGSVEDDSVSGDVELF